MQQSGANIVAALVAMDVRQRGITGLSAHYNYSL